MAENKGSTYSNSKYEIFQNDKGEILLMIPQNDGGPENPLFIYDGSQNALLYRSHESAVYFNDIVEGARSALKAVSEILIVEIDDNEVVREYKVPMRMVKDVKALM